MPALEAAETLLRSRRSVRSYKTEAVDKALLSRILETCRYAPTASNSQLVRWVVTENMEKTKKLGTMVVDFFRAGLSKNPDPRLASLIKTWDSGYDFVFRGAPQLAVAVYEKQYDFHEDAAIALTYFELAAHAHKIGCCWAGFFTRAARQSPEIQKFLGIRENEMIVGGQMFGHLQGLALSHVLPPRKKVDLTWL
jgi:nitroreductase